MISDLGTYIQYISAIYFTITLDNLLCKRFWSPNYYSLIIGTIKRYGFQFSSNIQKKIELKISDKAYILETKSRKRGAYMLFLCLMLLIYIGFESTISESSADMVKVDHYFPIFSTLFYSTLVLLFMNRTLNRWRFVLLNMLIAILILTITSFLSTNFITIAFLINLINSTKVFLTIILLLPILYQLYINWLYSIAYQSYLNANFSFEYDLYKRAKEALEKKDKKLCPEEYISVFGGLYLEDSNPTKDQPITALTKHLNERLEKIYNSTSAFEFIKAHWKSKRTKELQDNNNTSTDINDTITTIINKDGKQKTEKNINSSKQNETSRPQNAIKDKKESLKTRTRKKR